MKLYVIIDRETGEPVRDKAYVKENAAKLALRYHYGSRPEYGVGVVEGPIKMAWTIGADGKWADHTEVLADDGAIT